MYPWKQNNYTSNKDYCPLTYVDFKFEDSFIKNSKYNKGRQVVTDNRLNYPMESLENRVILDEKLINHED